jgi:drug/metabolite transporter (DMT)-like permease
MLATFASDFIVRAHTSMLQLAAGVVSVCGVVLVSQPWHDTEITGGSVAHPNSRLTSSRMSGSMLSQNFTSHLGILAPNSISFHYTFATLDRIIAVGAALVGVAGGATAYVAMVFIGNRAHSVVTVYHFATWTVVMTGFGLLFTGTDNFRMPTLLEWVLLAFLGLSSLMLQTLVAASLQGEGSTVALNMTYTQIVFSLVMDKVVWDISPNRISLIGGGLILSSVIAVTAMEQGDIDPHTSHCESEMVDECHNACETELTLAQEEEGQEMVAR